MTRLSLLDLTEFTETHVHPVAKHTDDAGVDFFDECHPTDPDLYAWGVYLRHSNYQLRHIADCDTEADAALVALALDHLISLSQRLEA